MAAFLRSPIAFLMMLNFVNLLGFAGWNVLFNNFGKEVAGFGGQEIGIVQSVREIPGLLAFTAIVWFLVLREQTFALISLVLLSLGICIAGYFPSLGGVLMTTVIMSVGFHYSETVNQSLGLQLFSKAEAPKLMGRVASAGAAAQFLAYGGMALLWFFGVRNFAMLFMVLGIICLAFSIGSWLWFPKINGTVPQSKKIILRKRYWLYYAMTLMSGARRQILTAFAGFFLVERFGFTMPEMAVLFLCTAGANTLLGPHIGSMIGNIGERRTIILENVSLVAIFLGYVFVTDGRIAAILFILDGVVMTFTLAQRTYFQKIGDAADMAPTSAVAFTINHIAAVFIPVVFGLLWKQDPSLVFKCGIAIALISLTLALIVPRDPGHGQETVFSEKGADATAALPSNAG